MQHQKQTVKTPFNRHLRHSQDNPPVSPLASRSDGHRISSQSLFGNHQEISIMHGGERYSLRITRLDKLILTK